jgi:2,5-dihydroxypyridine 5,6-dioxygenase
VYNADHGFDLKPVFQRLFELCELKSTENAVILSTASKAGKAGPWAYSEQYVKAATAAFGAMGVKSFNLQLPPTPKPWLSVNSKAVDSLSAGSGPTSLTSNPLAVETLRQARIIETGTRLVMVIELPEALVRLFPSTALRQALESAKKMLDQGPKRVLHVSSKHGTNLTMDVGQLETFYESGYANEPGTFDCFPSGQVCWCPDDHSSNGTFVIPPGEQILNPFQRYVESPVTLQVEDGYIRSIEGGADARLIRENMATWNDPEVYALGHQGLGLHPRARWDALAVYGLDSMGMDGRIMKGTYLIGTGSSIGNGGTRSTPCHFDISMRDCSVELDGRQLFDSGRIVAEELDVSAEEVGL